MKALSSRTTGTSKRCNAAVSLAVVASGWVGVDAASAGAGSVEVVDLLSERLVGAEVDAAGSEVAEGVVDGEAVLVADEFVDDDHLLLEIESSKGGRIRRFSVWSLTEMVRRQNTGNVMRNS